MSLQSMVGAPVIIKHQDVTDENADELRCGVISKAYFNDFDGWYYAEGIIWDTKAQELINNKDWSVSCSYDFLSYNDEGGVENNIKYDKEFTSLNFTHLALVNNPRYERANIVFNSKLIDNARGFDGSEGQCVTIKGTHVFIPDGKTLDDVLEEKGWSKKPDTKDKQEITREKNREKLKKVGKEVKSQIEKIYGDDKDLMEYFSVDTDVKENYFDDGSDMQYIEVRGELSYDEMTKLASKLDKVIQKYDKDAYFDQDTGGIMSASINFDRDKQEKTKDKQETNFEKYAFNKENFQKAIKQSDIKSIEKSIKDLRTRFDWAFGTDKKQQVIKDLDELYDTLSEASTNEISEDEFENLVSQISEVDKYISDIMTKDYTKEDKSTKAKYLGVKKSKTDNSKEKEMSLIDEIKKLIRKVENNKETEEMIENEKTDKRKLIDEVAGIMKSAGCDDEDIRTAIGKMEKIGYDASEDSKADNKKVKNEDEEDKKEDKEVDNEDAEDKKEAEDLEEDEKEDVKNKCKNDKSSFDKINEIYNSVKTLKEKTEYETRDVKLKNAEEYFG